MFSLIFAQTGTAISISIESKSVSTTPLKSNLIVTFGESSEELLARNTLLENFPNAIESYYFKTDFSALKNIDNIFIVGHGVDSGISFNGFTTPYKSINYQLSKANADNIYYVACNTFAAASSLDNAFGFDGMIEPKLGAMIVSYLAGSSQVTPYDLFNRANVIEQNPSQYSTLYLGPNEQRGYTEIILYALAVAVLSAMVAIAKAYFKEAVKYIVKYLSTTVLKCFAVESVKIIQNGGSSYPQAFLDCVGTIISTIIDVAYKVYDLAPWWMKAALWTALLADIAIATIGFWAKVAIIVGVLIGLTYILYWYNKDSKDSNDIFMG